MDFRVVQWMRRWMNDCIQRVVVNCSISGWRSVTSGVPQGSILVPVLFYIFLSYTDPGTKCNLNKFADDRKLRDMANKQEGQDDMDRLEKWAHVDLMIFSKAKCKVLQFFPLLKYVITEVLPPLVIGSTLASS